MDKENRKSISRKRHTTEEFPTSIPKSVRDDRACFREGSIRKLVLHNFLTFDDVVLEPSPQLNVIVAPNGTGKSSLVCAICIALCGNTSLLGRAKELKDFVKHGQAKDAFVEITLHHKGGNHPIIKRVIYKDRNNSKWFINGKDKKEQEVKEIVKRFNVQLENKCQFLPQDKVVEFAKLDCHQLLEETEKAIGTENMYELHQQLKGMKNERSKLENSLNVKVKEVNELTRRNKLLEMDVNRIKTRQESLNTIKNLTWKKCWVDYEGARVKYVQCKERKKKVEKEAYRLHQRLDPIKNKMKQNEAAVQKFEDLIKTHCRELTAHERKIGTVQQALKEVTEEQKNECQTYEQVKEDSSKQQEKILSFQNQINSLKNEMAALPDAQSIEPQVAAKNQELHGILQEISQLQSNQHDVIERKTNYEEQIKSSRQELSAIDNVYKQRLDALSRRDQDTVSAIKWLKENRNIFSKPVYEPVLMLLHIKDMTFASQIENAFSGKDLFAFVFESREDRDKFAREVRDKMNLKVNMVIAPSSPLNHFNCSVPMSTLKRFGFDFMLMDLIDAPAPILSYYCKQHFLHEIPLAKSKLSSQQLSNFTSAHPGIQRFYTADQMYIIRKSRYRQESIAKSDQVRRCYYFISSSNEETKRTLLQNIQIAEEELGKLEEEKSRLSDVEMSLRQKDNTIRQERQRLRESLNRRKRIKTSIQQKEIQLQQLQENPINVEEEFRKLKHSLIMVCGKKKEDRLMKMSVYIETYQSNLLNKIKSQFNLMVAKKKRDDFELEFREVTNELKESQKAVQQAKEAEAASKEEAKKLMETAQTVTGVENYARLPPEMTAMFTHYPEDSAMLEEMIHEHQAQVAMHSSELSDPDATVRQFEENAAKISCLQETIDSEQELLQNHETDTEALKRRWLDPLTSMIDNINVKFSQFFKDMNCAGEVGLLQHENDYSQFGVQIRVKFRSDDELHVLDAHHQSGGERSVSTMLYLMALQEITSCPFRVVDEINQGMDSSNERRVFDQIVTTVSRKDTSQYFLLSPKLLQNLHYTPAVTVHIIQNGPKMVPCWDRNLYL